MEKWKCCCILGLFETLTETASSSDCPGQCVHLVRSFMCEEVLENVSCPGNLKCCGERRQRPGPPPHGPPPQRPGPPGPPHMYPLPPQHNNNWGRPGPPPPGQYYPARPLPPIRQEQPSQPLNSGPEQVGFENNVGQNNAAGPSQESQQLLYRTESVNKPVITTSTTIKPTTEPVIYVEITTTTPSKWEFIYVIIS